MHPKLRKTFEQAPRVDRPPQAICCATKSTLPATQGQRLLTDLVTGATQDWAMLELFQLVANTRWTSDSTQHQPLKSKLAPLQARKEKELLPK
jgi:hypothetical protein